MESRFNCDFFVGNRQRLRELFTGTAPIVVAANGLLQRGADSSYGFTQDANFWYLTGIDEADLVLVLDRDKEYLIIPERSASRQAFDGVLDEDAMRQRSGIKTIYSDKEGWDQLSNRLKRVKHAATLATPPAYVEHYGLYTNPARAAVVARLKQEKPELELLDLSPHLSRLRMIKQPPELAAIQSAIDITAASIKESTRSAKLKKYAYEYEIEAELSRGFRRRGAAGHGFEPIVAGGARACTLHNVANSGALSADELVLLDVGAEVDHYSADITRTVAISTPSKRQQTVFDAVLDVQAFAFDLLRVGVLLKEYEQQIEHYMGEKLRELGLIKTISHENIRAFYPHATSHFLGLNVHDVGDYERPLEAGSVLTVEPGIYIPSEGIGIRIEDDVLLTSKGIKILSNKLPRSLS
ncbi:MAG: aminopeptidase P family protein [Patescibacteria group bacterium]